MPGSMVDGMDHAKTRFEQRRRIAGTETGYVLTKPSLAILDEHASDEEDVSS